MSTTSSSYAIIRLQLADDGIHLPVSLWRTRSGVDGETISERHSDFSAKLSTIDKTPCPCASQTQQDIKNHRKSGLMSTLYDFSGNEAVLLKASSCASTEPSAIFGFGYGSPALEVLYNSVSSKKRNFSIMFSSDGSDGSLIVGRDITSLQDDSSILSIPFNPSTTGLREFTINDVNGNMLTFPIGIGVNTLLNDIFISYNPNISNVLDNAHQMPFRFSLDSGGSGNPPVQLKYINYPDLSRATVKSNPNSAHNMFGLGFCMGKSITFDDEKHVAYIQDTENAWPPLPSVRQTQSTQTALETSTVQRNATEEAEHASPESVYKNGKPVEPNIIPMSTETVLPDATQYYAESIAELEKQICTKKKSELTCNSVSNCRWDSDEEVCNESFRKLIIASIAVVVCIPLAYFIHYKFLPTTPFWKSYPSFIYKAYVGSNGLSVISAIVILIMIHTSSLHAAYRHMYTQPLMLCAVSMSLLPIILGLCIKYDVSMLWLVPFTIMAIVGVIQITKMELKITNPSTQYNTIPSYLLLFNFIFVEGIIWWLLYIFS